MTTREARSTARRRRLRASYAAKGLPCAICGGEIDYRAARGESPDALHVDHDLPLHAGGQDTDKNCQPVHARCNLVKQDRLLNAYGELVKPPRQYVTDLTWN